MAITDVLLTNTFDEWRDRTNQIITRVNSFDDSIVPDLYLRSNSTNTNVASAFAQANGVALGANSYSNTLSINTGAGANAYANVVSNLVFRGANSRMDFGGLQANSFASNTIEGANNRLISIIAGANTAVGNAANSNSWARIASVSATLQTSINGANANAANATYMTTGTVASARISGSYTGITGVGTITTGTWQASTLGVDYGGTGATTIFAARTNLGVGNNALGERYVSATQPASAVNGDIWYKV